MNRAIEGAGPANHLSPPRGVRSRRREGAFRWRRLRHRAPLAVLAALLFFPDLAAATIRLDEVGLGRLELAGNVQTQNILRHSDATTLQFIQQRNVFRIRLDWQLVQGNQLLTGYRIPAVRKATVFALYRFVYDSIYDYTPDVLPRFDFRGTSIKSMLRAFPETRRRISRRDLSLAALPGAERDAYKFENRLREVYIDLKLRDIPLSLRIGRQQIVWGEADFARMLDRVNTLDLTWHGGFEIPPPAFGWDEIRRPFWMLKGLYDLGTFGPLGQAFVEFYWNPGDWHPAKVAFLPRPWGLAVFDPLTNPVDGAFNYGPCALSRVAANPLVGQGRCTRLMKGTRAFQQGDYSRFDPISNSQVGIRFHALAPQGIEFSLNYLWQRWGGDDGTNFAPLKALPIFNRKDPSADPNAQRAEALLLRGILPAEYIAPYIHTVGIAANYADERHTQVLFRLETILDFGIPFFDRGKRTVLDDLLPGVTRKNMWKGMIAAERFVWIPSLNRKSTFFFTGQFLWHHVINNPGCPDFVGANFGRNGRSCLTGGLDLPSVDRPKSQSFRDKIRDWEALASLATFTFYKGGSIVPALGCAVDPVNKWESLAFWSVDYFIRPDVIVNLTQRYLLNLTGDARKEPIFATWGLGGLNRARSETSLRITYQF